MTNEPVLLVGNQITAYTYIATLRGLEMELLMAEMGWAPTACPTRGRALASAKRILAKHERHSGGRITRKQARDKMHALCVELQLVKEGDDGQTAARSEGSQAGPGTADRNGASPG